MSLRSVPLVVMMVLASLLVACSADCPYGHWKVPYPDADIHADCEMFDLVWIQRGAVVQTLNSVALCGSSSAPTLYLLDGNIDSRDVEIDSDEIYYPETSKYYSDHVVYSCGQDDILLAGEYVSGTWERPDEAEYDAVKALFDLQCHEHWQGCYSGFFADQPCDDESDCPYADCEDEGYCDFPWS